MSNSQIWNKRLVGEKKIGHWTPITIFKPFLNVFSVVGVSVSTYNGIDHQLSTYTAYKRLRSGFNRHPF